MPIRFRCVYCDKLLGIASRKAGTVVNCAQCGQPLIVPTPTEMTNASVAPSHVPQTSPPKVATSKSAPVPQRLFESQDFDRILEGDQTVRTDKATMSPATTAPAPARVLAALAVEDSDPEIDVELIPVRKGFSLSVGLLLFLILIVLLLIGGAFTAGIIVGKRMVAG